MKFALLFSLLFPMASFASDLSDSNCLFDLAEQTFPDILSSPDGATFISSGFLVRQYSDPDVVIGTKDGDSASLRCRCAYGISGPCSVLRR